MSWINFISYKEAKGDLKLLYDKIKSPNDHIDNVLLIHSLRPHTLEGHMSLYKSVLHNLNNRLPKWYLEALGVYVSHLNNCEYCVNHHLKGLERQLKDISMAKEFLSAVSKSKANTFFGERYDFGFDYAYKLTVKIADIEQSDISHLMNRGFNDGEILEINQLVAYFNYVNRTVVGLGVQLEETNIGLSPNDAADPTNWEHR